MAGSHLEAGGLKGTPSSSEPAAQGPLWLCANPCIAAACCCCPPGHPYPPSPGEARVSTCQEGEPCQEVVTGRKAARTISCQAWSEGRTAGASLPRGFLGHPGSLAGGEGLLGVVVLQLHLPTHSARGHSAPAHGPGAPRRAAAWCWATPLLLPDRSSASDLPPGLSLAASGAARTMARFHSWGHEGLETLQLTPGAWASGVTAVRGARPPDLCHACMSPHRKAHPGGALGLGVPRALANHQVWGCGNRFGQVAT